MRSAGVTNVAPWAAAPAVGPAGDTYFDTGIKTLYVSDGTQWLAVGMAGAGVTAWWFGTVGGTAATANVTVALTPATTTAGGFSIVSNSVRCAQSGRYLVQAAFSFPNTTSRVITTIRQLRSAATIRDSVTWGATVPASATGQTHALGVFDLIAGDDIQLLVNPQTAGIIVDPAGSQMTITPIGGTSAPADTVAAQAAIGGSGAIGTTNTQIGSVSFVGKAGTNYKVWYSVVGTGSAVNGTANTTCRDGANPIASMDVGGTCTTVGAWATYSAEGIVACGGTDRTITISVWCANVTAGTFTVNRGAIIVTAETGSTGSPLNPGPWQTPTLLNGWVNVGAGGQTVRYRLFGDMVYIEGQVKSGTLNTVVFNLPVGYRPLLQVYAPVAAGSVVGQVAITTGGDVYIQFGSTTATELRCQFATT